LEAASTAGRGRTLEGEKPRRAAGTGECNSEPEQRTPGGEQSPEGDDRQAPSFFGREVQVGERQEGRGRREAEQLLREGKALKGEPHRRQWHETRPRDAGRGKPPGG
jgi:hypothetical protein